MEDIKDQAAVMHRILKEKGIVPLLDLLIYTPTSERELYLAIGWLACEKKIHLIIEEDDDWRIMSA